MRSNPSGGHPALMVQTHATTTRWQGQQQAGAAVWPWARTIPMVAGGLCFIVLSVLAIARHRAFATGWHDLEIYAQVLWNLANGAPFESTLLRTNSLHLAEHLALVLLPLAPLYGLVPDVHLLLITQSLALAGMVTILGAWTCSRLGVPTGAAVVVCGLLQPALAAIGLDDFHAVTLTAAPIAAGLVLVLAGWQRAGALLLLTSAIMEEEASLAAIGLGLYLLSVRHRRLGTAVLGAGALFLVAATFVVMPSFHQSNTLSTGSANRTTGHFSAVRAQPTVLIDRIMGQRGRDAATSLLLPSGGLTILSPGLLVAGVPTFAALFLQDRDDTFTRHWSTPLLPVFWLAIVTALLRAGRHRRVGLAVLAAGTLGAFLLASPLPGGGASRASDFERGSRERALERAVRAVPPRVPMVASANLAAHLTDRRELFVFPIDDQYLSALRYEDRAVEAFVLDFNDPATQRVRALSKSSPLTAEPPYVVQSAGHKILILTRTMTAPEQPLGLRFGNGMGFRGYQVELSTGSVLVALYWERIAGIAGDWERIVQLLDASGQVVAEDSDLELTRTLPTQKWQLGQKVLDEVELRSLRDIGPGWTLRVQWQNRERKTPIRMPGGSEAFDIPL